MSNLTREEQHAKDLAAVKQNGHALRHVDEQTLEICLAAVEQYGYALLHVDEQTEEICLAAVKQNGFALYHVEVQTEEICLAAVKKNGLDLWYVEEQFKESCTNYLDNKHNEAKQGKTNMSKLTREEQRAKDLAAVKQNGWAEEPLVNAEEEGSSFSLLLRLITTISIVCIFINTHKIIDYYW